MWSIIWENRWTDFDQILLEVLGGSLRLFNAIWKGIIRKSGGSNRPKTPELFLSAYITKLIHNSISCTPNVMVMPPRLSLFELHSGVFFIAKCNGMVLKEVGLILQNINRQEAAKFPQFVHTYFWSGQWMMLWQMFTWQTIYSVFLHFLCFNGLYKVSLLIKVESWKPLFKYHGVQTRRRPSTFSLSATLCHECIWQYSCNKFVEDKQTASLLSQSECTR